MGFMSTTSVRVFVAALLLIATGPWMPVLCHASDHVAFEYLDALCCGPRAEAETESQGIPRLLSQATAGDCGSCTDTTLDSVLRSESAPNALSPDTVPAAIPMSTHPPQNFFVVSTGEFGARICPPSFDSSAALLRC